jgi:hypothetical protein
MCFRLSASAGNTGHFGKIEFRYSARMRTNRTPVVYLGGVESDLDSPLSQSYAETDASINQTFHREGEFGFKMKSLGVARRLSHMDFGQFAVRF